MKNLLFISLLVIIFSLNTSLSQNQKNTPNEKTEKKEISEYQDLVKIDIDNSELKMMVVVKDSNTVLQGFQILDEKGKEILSGQLQFQMQDFQFTLQDLKDGKYTITFYFIDTKYSETESFEVKRKS